MATIYDLEQETKKLGPDGPMAKAYNRLSVAPSDIAARGGLVLTRLDPKDKCHRFRCDLYFAGPFITPWSLKQLRYTMGVGITTLPSFADVLAAYMSDAIGVIDVTFANWASEFGYSADSIKARDIYLACVDARAKLAPVLAEYEKMQTAHADLDVEAYCLNNWATLKTFRAKYVLE